MSDIQSHQNMWFPGPSSIYEGRRDEEYTQLACHLSDETLIELVQKRAQEDSAWILEQGADGGDTAMMHRMVEWVSNPKVIVQCADANLDKGPTVDWVCRELGVASQTIVRGIRDRG